MKTLYYILQKIYILFSAAYLYLLLIILYGLKEAYAKCIFIQALAGSREHLTHFQLRHGHRHASFHNGTRPLPLTR